MAWNAIIMGAINLPLDYTFSSHYKLHYVVSLKTWLLGYVASWRNGGAGGMLERGKSKKGIVW